jgi:hypothetical protein
VSNQPANKNQQLLEQARLLYEEGAFDVEIAKHLGITIKRFNEMYDTNPQFTKFVDMGRTLSMAFWYGLGRRGTTMKGFNGQTWAFVMKNQFGWADKIETATQQIENENLDDLKSKLRKALQSLSKNSPELVDAVKEIAVNE